MLRNKVAVITGGSRGIGRAIALRLAEAGADVAIWATRESEEAVKTGKLIEKLGVRAGLYYADVSDRQQVFRTAEAVLKDFGHVDILVNNAGITRDGLLLSMEEEDVDRVIDVNLKGTIHVTEAFLRSMVRNRSGSVINLSSVVGLMGNKGQTNYAASKAGIVGFTKSLAKEYGKKGIRANAIAPGFICTEMTEVLSGEQKEAICGNLCVERLGTPEDVAALALFLASENASYITGEVIKVDGGMYV